MTTVNVVKIINGPSREELFDALRLRTKVHFTLEDSQTRVSVFVNAIEAEDGSGNSWVLKLYDESRVLVSERLNGYLNTRNRKGHLQPFDDSLAD